MAQSALTQKTVKIANLRGNGKVAKSFPANVRDAILAMADAHPSLKSFSFKAVDETYKFSAGEGYEYSMVVGDDKRSIEMVSEDTVGGMNLSFAIGAPITVPVGGFLITVCYYGGYMMDVYNVQPARVQTPAPDETPNPELVDYARKCLAESIGLNLDLIDPTRESTICKNCGSTVPAMKDGRDYCIICGEAPYTLPDGVLNVSHFTSAIISVDYREYNSDTYNGLYLRVAYNYSGDFILLFKTPKSYEAKMQKRFENDWTTMCKYISKMGWADQEFMCSSSVDHFIHDARISGKFMGR